MSYLYVVSALLGGLFAGLGLPMALGRVAPNRAYGFRTQRTLADEGVWYAANRFAGRALVVAGVVTVVASLVCLVVGEPLEDLALALSGVIALLPLAVAIVAAVIYYRGL